MRKMGFFGKRKVVSLNPINLSGLIVPLVTPLNKDKSLDLSLKTLVARLMNKGVTNFFCLGLIPNKNFVHCGKESNS